MPRVLLVEDCPSYRGLVSGLLRDLCTVIPVPSVAEARARVTSEEFDLILLDVDLPDGNGYEFCSGLRALLGGNGAPVVFLTGRSSPHEVFVGVMAGAVDYIVKPLLPDEFRQRIGARLRDGVPAPRPEPDQRFYSGNLRIDPSKGLACADTPRGYVDLGLTPAEFRLLDYLARHPGETLSRDRILRDVWGPRAALMSERAIDAHVQQLRKKLPLGPCWIESALGGDGYRYKDSA